MCGRRPRVHAETTIGYVHIDYCELRLADGKLRMFLAMIACRRSGFR